MSATQPFWRQSLNHSLNTNKANAHAKFFHVANVDQQGFAQNRSMVFRGFVENSNSILAITDIRSDKVAQWRAHPYAHISWYFTESREQYRIKVKVLLQRHYEDLKNSAHTNNSLVAMRSRIWQNLSEPSRSQFEWMMPKLPLNPFVEATNQLKGKAIQSDDSKPSNKPHRHFVLVCFEPLYIDYLNLKTNPQSRVISQWTKNRWSDQDVNP